MRPTISGSLVPPVAWSPEPTTPMLHAPILATPSARHTKAVLGEPTPTNARAKRLTTHGNAKDDVEFDRHWKPPHRPTMHASALRSSIGSPRACDDALLPLVEHAQQAVFAVLAARNARGRRSKHSGKYAPSKRNATRAIAGFGLSLVDGGQFRPKLADVGRVRSMLGKNGQTLSESTKFDLFDRHLQIRGKDGYAQQPYCRKNFKQRPCSPATQH